MYSINSDPDESMRTDESFDVDMSGATPGFRSRVQSELTVGNIENGRDTEVSADFEVQEQFEGGGQDNNMTS